MAPRQAPAGVQARGRGPVQGHHPGVRGSPGPAGEQGGSPGVQRRREEELCQCRRWSGGDGAGSREREGRRTGQDERRRATASSPHSAGQGVPEGVQLHGHRRRRAARVRRVLQLRRAQGAAAGAQGGVHPRGALRRVQEGGQVHPRRRHQERADREGGGDADHQGEARVEEGDQGDVRGHGQRAAGLPPRRRRVHRVGEEAQGVQAAGGRPGAQGGGAAGERAHGLVLLVPASGGREGELVVPGRGHRARVREGGQGGRHARRRRPEGRARGPEGQVRRRLPQEPHRRAAEGPRRDPQGLRLNELFEGRAEQSLLTCWSEILLVHSCLLACLLLILQGRQDWDGRARSSRGRSICPCT